MTIERLEYTLLKLAYIIDRYGDVYLPLFERMEDELAKMRRVQASRDRARAYLDANRHRLAERGLKS